MSKKASILIAFIVVGAGVAMFAAWLIVFKEVSIVIDTEGRKGGVLVRLEDEELGETDSSGAFRKRRRLRKGESFRLSFSHPGYTVTPQDTTLTVDNQSEWEIRLRLSGGRFELVVSTQPPTSGARIQIDGESMGVTGADGSWRGEVANKNGNRHVYVQGPQGVREWETRQALVEGGGPLIAQLGAPPGVRLLLTAAHNLSGVQVQVGGRPMGETNAQGKASITIPTARQGQRLNVTFSYAGGTIPAWRPSVPKTPARLTRTIQVRPETSPLVQMTAVSDNNQPAEGIGLLVNQKSVGITDASGKVQATLADVLLGQTVTLGVTAPENLAVVSLNPQKITISTDQSLHMVQAVFDIAKFIILRTRDQGAPMDGVTVFRGDKELGKTKGGEFKDRVPKLGETYSYRLKKPRFMTVEASVVPTEVQTTRDVIMQPFAFSVVVTDRFRSTPVSDVSVYAASDPNHLLGSTDGGGRVTIRGWGDLGNHKLMLKKTMFRDEEIDISLDQNNQEVPALIEGIPPQLNLRFRADGAGTPIRNARVFIQEGASLVGTTDGEGKVRFESPGLTIGQEYGGVVQYQGFSEPFTTMQAQHVTSVVFDVPLVCDVTLVANDPAAVIRVYTGAEVVERTHEVNVKLRPNPAGYRVWAQVQEASEQQTYTYDKIHHFNHMVIRETIPVVTWHVKGMVAYGAGRYDEAKTYFQRVLSNEQEYGLSQIKIGEIALEKRNQVAGDAEKKTQASEAVQAFENAWKKTGDWKFNPYFAHRNMTLNYELDIFDAADQWFYRLQRIGMDRFRPEDLPEMLVNSYFYQALNPSTKYIKDVSPNGGDATLKQRATQGWNKFERILNNQPDLPDGRRTHYQTVMQQERDKLAVAQ